MKIDFVIAWVDGNDPAWMEERRKYSPDAGADGCEARYRDTGILKYWFRAVEEYAPWVNKIHFITWGHLPEWLNTDHPKLNIVNHKDYIPSEYLPTFSSHTIELNMHRIPGLSEHFVYFNDDMLLNGPVSTDFFFHKELPCDFAHINNIYNSDSTDICEHIRINCTWRVNNHHSYIKAFLRNPIKYATWKYPFKNLAKNILKLENVHNFQGFEDHHLASSYLKSTLIETWKESEDILNFTCNNKFRSPLDVSQSIFRYKQLAQGKFFPISKKSRGKFISLKNDLSSITEDLLNQNIKMVCINDAPNLKNWEKIASAMISIYEKKFSNKSTFEK